MVQKRWQTSVAVLVGVLLVAGPAQAAAPGEGWELGGWTWLRAQFAALAEAMLDSSSGIYGVYLPDGLAEPAEGGNTAGPAKALASIDGILVPDGLEPVVGQGPVASRQEINGVYVPHGVAEPAAEEEKGPSIMEGINGVYVPFG